LGAFDGAVELAFSEGQQALKAPELLADSRTGEVECAREDDYGVFPLRTYERMILWVAGACKPRPPNACAASTRQRKRARQALTIK
jgi:hypothetical protein